MVVTPCWLVCGPRIYKYTYTWSFLLASLSLLSSSLLLQIDGHSGKCGGVVMWVVFLGVEALVECSSMTYANETASPASRRSLPDQWTASLLIVCTHHGGGALTLALLMH